MLRSRSIDVLEFEFIARGFWRRDHADQRPLSDVLRRLYRWGYLCYWQGDSGQLARANGDHSPCVGVGRATKIACMGIDVLQPQPQP